MIPGLYAVTPDGLSSADLLDRVEQSLHGGVRLLQYRAKPMPGQDQAAHRLDAMQVAGAVATRCRAFGAMLIVNDDADLAAEVGADGVHLGRDDGSVQQARARLGSGRLIGVSCYDCLERALAAAADGADYVAFGSMFPSTVKPHAVRAPLSLLSRARERIKLPIVAIGGIDAGNAAAVVRAGAHSLAVISAVFSAPDIGAAVRHLNSVIETASRPTAAGPGATASTQSNS
jgi:thiamine-phosphate pyrophosphorylase